jgi:hypothetical protein
MDNFEWAEGFRRRFGLHYVEFGSGRRVAKRSAQFYRQLALTGELPSSADAFAAAVGSPAFAGEPSHASEEPEIPEAPAAV